MAVRPVALEAGFRDPGAILWTVPSPAHPRISSLVLGTAFHLYFFLQRFFVLTSCVILARLDSAISN